MRLDRARKVGVYARVGVAHPWLLDPVARLLETYRLDDVIGSSLRRSKATRPSAPSPSPCCRSRWGAGGPQRRLVDRAADHGDLWVSEITFWEIASHVERGRLDLGGLALDEWLERAAAEPLVRRHGITPAVAKELTALSVTRDWDPADRIIVATARVLRATLVTNDARIHESKLVDVA